VRLFQSVSVKCAKKVTGGLWLSLHHVRAGSQATLSRQVLIDRPAGLTTFPNSLHQERLNAPGVARDEYPVHVRYVVSAGHGFAMRVELDAQFGNDVVGLGTDETGGDRPTRNPG
jgi:hypothetical protein